MRSLTSAATFSALPRVRLVNNARLAIDACALDDIVVKLLALFLRD